MTDLPRPSAGVLAAPLGQQHVLWEPRSRMVHVLSASASAIWDACGSGVDVEEFVEMVSVGSAAPAALVRSDVARFVGELLATSLLGNDDPVSVPVGPQPTPVAGAWLTRSFPVLDERVVVHSDDQALLAALEDAIGLVTDEPPTHRFAVGRDGAGALRLAGHDWSGTAEEGTRLIRRSRNQRSQGGLTYTQESLDDLLAVLVGEMNLVAADNPSVLALHAGGVRAPSGHVVVLPGQSGSGKSTLTAALVQAGWDYLADEAVGIRVGTLAVVTYPKALSLGVSSRRALGLSADGPEHVRPSELRPGAMGSAGVVGPVDLVVLPRFVAGAETHLATLDAEEAVTAVAENALNLLHTGQTGLDALVQMAERIPCRNLVHGGIGEAVAALTALVGRSTRNIRAG